MSGPFFLSLAQFSDHKSARKTHPNRVSSASSSVNRRLSSDNSSILASVFDFQIEQSACESSAICKALTASPKRKAIDQLKVYVKRGCNSLMNNNVHQI